MIKNFAKKNNKNLVLPFIPWLKLAFCINVHVFHVVNKQLSLLKISLVCLTLAIVKLKLALQTKLTKFLTKMKNESTAVDGCIKLFLIRCSLLRFTTKEESMIYCSIMPPSIPAGITPNKGVKLFFFYEPRRVYDSR